MTTTLLTVDDVLQFCSTTPWICLGSTPAVRTIADEHVRTMATALIRRAAGAAEAAEGPGWQLPADIVSPVAVATAVFDVRNLANQHSRPSSLLFASAQLVIGTVEWSYRERTFVSPCQVCDVELIDNGDGQWTVVSQGVATPNHAVIAVWRMLGILSASDDAGSVRLSDAMGCRDSSMYVHGTHNSEVKLTRLGNPVTAQLTAAAMEVANGQPYPTALQPQGFLLRPNAPEPLLVIDADASQLSVLAMLLRQQSVSVDAAPGTGVTQMIANLVINNAAERKTTLVICADSDEQRDLQARLHSVGFGSALCAIGESSTSPTELLAHMRHVMRNPWRPAAASRGDDGSLQRLETVLLRSWGQMSAPLVHGLTLFEALCESSAGPATVADVSGPLEQLTSALYQQRRQAVHQFAAAASALGEHSIVAEHPWRLSTLASWTTDQEPQLSIALHALLSVVKGLSQRISAFDLAVPGLDLSTTVALQRIAAIADLALQWPGLGVETMMAARTIAIDPLSNPLSRAQQSFAPPTNPVEYFELALLQQCFAAASQGVFAASVEDVDFPQQISALQRALDGAAALRFLRSRAPRTALSVHLLANIELDDESLLAAAEIAYANKRLRQCLARQAESAVHWFGPLYNDAGLQIEQTKQALQWAANLRKAFDACAIVNGNREQVWRSFVAQIAAPDGAVFALGDDVGAFIVQLNSFAQLTTIDIAANAAAREDSPSLLLEMAPALQGWQSTVGALAGWVEYRNCRQRATQNGLDALIFQFEAQAMTADKLSDAWHTSVNEGLLRHAFSKANGGGYQSAELERWIAEFSQLDSNDRAVAKSRALTMIAEHRPVYTVQRAGTPLSEMSLAQAQLVQLLAAKPTENAVAQTPRWSTLAQILADFSELWPTLAPAMMMSVEQASKIFADPVCRVAFDCVVVLDAHQVSMVSVAATVRNAQCVASIGQAALAQPRSLMARMSSRELQSAQVRLGHCYRMRHPGLLVKSQDGGFGLGLSAVPVAQHTPVFEQLMLTDSATFVDQIMQLHRSAPTQSLGVLFENGASHTEHLPTRDIWIVIPSDGGQSPGMERTSEAGERLFDHRQAHRLLAMLTFSTRKRLVLAQSPGVPVSQLASLLQSCQLRAGTGTGHMMARQLGELLAQRGWLVHYDVGSTAMKVDVAVVDPNDSERYVLAIEFDSGRSGHMNMSARVRSWPTQLQAAGWRHLRVWALDFLTDPGREAARVHGAIIAALAAQRQQHRPLSKANRPSSPAPAVSPAAERSAGIQIPAAVAIADSNATVQLSSESSAVLAAGSAPLVMPSELTVRTRTAIRLAIAPYVVAYVPAGRRSPNDVFSSKYDTELQNLVEQVLVAEAPIHVALLTKRVSAYFGLAKPTPDVAQRVLAIAGDSVAACWEPQVLWRRAQQRHELPSVRVVAANPQTKREIDHVPLMEIASAVRLVVERSPNISVVDVAREAAKLLGFARYTEDVKVRMQRGVEVAVFANAVSISEGRARVV
jgi:hypothetical protein